MIMYRLKPGLSFLLLFFAALTLSACSFISKTIPPEYIYYDSETYEVLDLLKSNNSRLNNYKGLGKVKLSINGNIPQIYRMAWLGSLNKEKLRIEILGVSGQPVASLTSDGKHLYFLSRMDNRFYKKRLSKKTTLEKLIQIPVKPSDIIDLFAGRVPVCKFYSAKMEQNNSNDNFVIHLKNKREKNIEVIYLDKSKKNAWGFEKYSASGALLYRAVFDNMININGFRIPSEIKISSDKNVVFSLHIDKYWTEASVSPELFVLKP